MNKLFLCFVLLVNISVWSQSNSDQQLATYYFNNGEYDKALAYYEKLFSKDASKINFNRLLTCYTETQANKEAEKLIKKAVQEHPTEAYFKFTLADYYIEQTNHKKAEEIYADLIDDLPNDFNSISDLFNEFLARNLYDNALKTLDRGKKITKGSNPLNTLYAVYYFKQGDFNKMSDAYLELIELNASYSSDIQEEMNRLIDFSDSTDAVYFEFKSNLLERIQKHPQETAYTSLLVFLYTQKQQFAAALVQLQSLDKRLKLEGREIYDFGKTCIENKDYATAKKAFAYIKSLGADNPFYNLAQNALLSTSYLELTTGRIISQVEIDQIIAEYKRVWEQIQVKKTAIQVGLELAHIQAFYGKQAHEAQQMLTDLLTAQGLTDYQRAEVKLKLADILVLIGDIWEASLYYMQVDADFKFEPIGQEAKFKNARIYYYDGEFDFAQSQLSVLKESTSKLIANDALQLSILITDNLGLDSNIQAMTWFAKGDLLLVQHDYEQAFLYYDSILKEFAYHSLGDEICLRKANALREIGKYEEAIRFLNEILNYNNTDILADDALFLLGDIYQYNLNDTTSALTAYKKLIFEQKGSFYASEVKKRIRILRGDEVDN